LVRIGARFDLKRAERLAPFAFGAGADSVETGAFCIEVSDGAGLIDARECNAHFERRGQRAEIEPRFERLAELFGQRIAATTRRLKALVRDLLVAIEEGMAFERRREAHREIELAPRRPAARLAETGKRAVGAKVQPRPENLARIIIERRAQVEQQVRVLARGEAVAVDADARACGEFGADAAIGERDGIIAGARLFGRMVEPLAITRAGLFRIARIELEVTDLRHDKDVAEVRMARA
jgi:hypothetical protein